MPLTSGTKIGPYEVASLLGVGGMGEVYRSRDSKLGREVAVKVLASAVAGDPDRLARFGREAKVLAALNHPNIAAIYGLEDSGATTLWSWSWSKAQLLPTASKPGRSTTRKLCLLPNRSARRWNTRTNA